MSLTRKSLKAMGLTDEQVDSIVEMHTETVDALKAQRDEYKTNAEKYTAVQTELDALKAKGDDGFKAKFEKVTKDFEDFKASVTAEKTAEKRTSAIKAYFEKAGIAGNNLAIAMRCVANEKLELDGDNLASTEILDNLVKGDLAGLVQTTRVDGQRVETPPSGVQQSELDALSDDDYYRAKFNTK